MRFYPCALLMVACVADTGDLDPGLLDASGGPINGSVDGGVPRDLGVEIDSPQLEDLLKACVMAASCDGGAIDRGTSSAVLSSDCTFLLSYSSWPLFTNSFGSGPSLQKIERFISCGASSASCDDFNRCFGGSLIGFSSCVTGAVCEGAEAVRVIDGRRRSFDCASIGATCKNAVVGQQMACCRPAECEVLPERWCEPQLFCADPQFGGGFYFDCTKTGRACLLDGIGLCEGPGPDCEGDWIRCDGSIATYCYAGRKQATFDCASTAATTRCGDGEPAGYPCATRFQECAPREFMGECDRDELIVCADGRKRRVDCGDLGFDICRNNTEGVAYCGFLE